MYPSWGALARTLVLLLSACGSSGGSPDAALAVDASPDAIISVPDGTPTRMPCTNQLGTGLTAAFGRLDGFLVAIIPPGTSPCNADKDHIHLQIRANNAVYDVAITVASMNGTVEDVASTTTDLWIPGWQEGWHTGATNGVLLDYVSRGIRSPAFTVSSRAQLTSALMTELASANHITVFATGYGPDGAHLVHRNGSGRDGAIVTQPLSAPGKARVFRFAAQVF